MKTILRKLAPAAVLLLVITSCSDDDQDITVDTQSDSIAFAKLDQSIDIIEEQDFALAIDLDENIDAIGGAISSKTMAKNGLPDCATVTRTGMRGQFPVVITVDFGTGCTGPRGNTRSGILRFTFSDRLRNAGATLTTERINYSINDRMVAGTIVRTNNGNAMVPDWTRTVTGGSITFLDGSVFSFDSTRSIRFLRGSNTTTLRDNVYVVYEGTRTITRRNGNTRTITITSPLRKPFACNYITAGTIDISGTNVNGSLDYGNGTCDDEAIFSGANGNSRVITL